MNIVILGAGEVGRTIIEELQQEPDIDITAVDIDSRKLDEVRDRFQIKTLLGHGSYPEVQREAGVARADVVLAVTASDEVNMVACQVAYSLFNSGTRIARIRSDTYTSPNESLFAREHMPIDVLINPEQLVTESIVQLIEQPGTTQVLNFADGRASLAAFEARHGADLIGLPIRELEQTLGKHGGRLAAIYRSGAMHLTWTTDIDPTIMAGDELFVLTRHAKLRSLMRKLLHRTDDYRKIMIAGGGNIGMRLAVQLEKESRFNVKIAEIREDRLARLSEPLNRTIALRGDATDGEFLRKNHIDRSDLFCAVTNDDEVNVMSSLLAKRMGVRHTIALIGKVPYVKLIGGTDIDVAISPQQATASSILRHVRGRSAAMVHRLKHGSAEVLEMVATGDAGGTKITSRRINQLKIPEGAAICAVVRENDVLVEFDHEEVKEDDHVIFIVNNKRHIKTIQRLFRPSPLYF